MAGSVLTTNEMLTRGLGTVSPVPMGDWNSTTQYQKLNIVRYNAASYIAKKQNQGFEPTVTAGWQEVWQAIVYDGRGIASATIDYQAGISNTTPPAGEWESEIPDVPQGQYLWTRTTVNYTDETQTVSYSVSLQGLGFTQQDRESLERITDVIPSSATVENPLTTEEFVNSSINNMAAFYIEYNAQGDAWPTRASLLSATTFYNAGQTRIPTTNDYATVLADESQPKGADGKYPTTRYSYQGGTYPNGQWGFQYVVNNTSLTQAQLNAINSGITSLLVSKIGVANLFEIPYDLTSKDGATSAIDFVANNFTIIGQGSYFKNRSGGAVDEYCLILNSWHVQADDYTRAPIFNLEFVSEGTQYIVKMHQGTREVTIETSSGGGGGSGSGGLTEEWVTNYGSTTYEIVPQPNEGAAVFEITCFPRDNGGQNIQDISPADKLISPHPDISQITYLSVKFEITSDGKYFTYTLGYVDNYSGFNVMGAPVSYVDGSSSEGLTVSVQGSHMVKYNKFVTRMQ